MPLTAVLLLVATAQSISIAEPEFNLVNISPEVGRFCGEQLATQMSSEGVRVMTQRQIASLLGMERQKELLGCADSSSSCMAELANALGTDGVTIGDLAKLGSRYQLTVKVLRSGSGELLATYSATLGSEDDLLPALNDAAKKLSAELLVKLRPQSAPAPGVEGFTEAPRSHRWPLWPTVAAGGFAVIGGTLHGFAAAQAAHLKDATAAPIDDSTARGIQRRGELLQDAAYVSYGLAAVSLGAAIFLYARGEPVVTAWAAPDGGGLSVSGAFP